MKTDQKLINEYLSNGGTVTIIPSKNTKLEPYKGQLIPTSHIKYDHSGQRIYRNRSKVDMRLEMDETRRDYGD